MILVCFVLNERREQGQAQYMYHRAGKNLPYDTCPLFMQYCPRQKKIYQADDSRVERRGGEDGGHYPR